MGGNRNVDNDRSSNVHAGAAFGLIIGVILGSLLLNVPAVAIASGQLRSAMGRLVGSIAPGPAQLGSRPAGPEDPGGHRAVARPAAAVLAGASAISTR